LNPQTLESVKNNNYIYLTTKGRKTGKPHTVQIWFALAEGKIYLSHEGAYTDWMKNLEKNEKVSARIASTRLDATAKIVKGSARHRGMKALYEKYYQPATEEVLEDWFELSTVIELTPL
jgi:deazaflavin-dependent oxidoreductase (nitroreductase family)